MWNDKKPKAAIGSGIVENFQFKTLVRMSSPAVCLFHHYQKISIWTSEHLEKSFILFGAPTSRWGWGSGKSIFFWYSRFTFCMDYARKKSSTMGASRGQLWTSISLFIWKIFCGKAHFYLYQCHEMSLTIPRVTLACPWLLTVQLPQGSEGRMGRWN